MSEQYYTKKTGHSEDRYFESDIGERYAKLEQLYDMQREVKKACEDDLVIMNQRHAELEKQHREKVTELSDKALELCREKAKLREALTDVLKYSQVHMRFHGIGSPEINSINNIANKALAVDMEETPIEVKNDRGNYPE